MERVVLLELDYLGEHVFCAVVQAPTGTFYEHQCGGMTCLQRSVEGYLVVIANSQVHHDRPRVHPSELENLFHEVGRCYLGEGRERDHRINKLRELVGNISTSVFHGGDPAFTGDTLVLDEARLDQIVEAFVPVLTPYGAGVLMWENCD